MIGVIADPADHDVVREFFELFKTPWEFCVANQEYDVVLITGDCQFEGTAKLVVFCAGGKTHFDDEHAIVTGGHLNHACVLSYLGKRVPIYGSSITFPEKGSSLLTEEDSQVCAGFLDESGDGAFARIGYDLFSEIRTLLTEGQPAANASMPALELHIALLRDLITECGISLIEIPPVPEGYRFIACLTHDVDHPMIRKHKWDHTMFGFLYRATFGSLRRLILGQMSVRDLLNNWGVALKLPLVYMGLAKDFWSDFGDRYLELESGLRSTFFVIPFSDRPGRASQGSAPAMRAAGYGAADIADTIRKLVAKGCEVGLHGIDAWLDGTEGRKELEEIQRITGASETGARMHWLYYDQQKSPAALEKAGAAYDSTMGYNGTIGYRAGTTQVYKPLDATLMLELPLHVMDTAMFYPNHLALSPVEAKTLLDPILDNAVQFGGTLTINWHDRSLAPERLWGTTYRELIHDMKSRGAWFSTAGQATSWFQKRRSVSFEKDANEAGGMRARVAVNSSNNLPGLQLRIHGAQKPDQKGTQSSDNFVDQPVPEFVDAEVAIGASR
jgi:hypothetical protein